MPDVIAHPDPTCHAPARIVDRWSWESTSGPVEHVKTGCQRGHWFTSTVDSLDPRPATGAYGGRAVAGARSPRRARKTSHARATERLGPQRRGHR